MTNVDIIIVASYLVLLFIWAIYIGLKESSEDYLVLSRKAPFLLVLFSIISTWVGTGTTVATASGGYDKGISLGLTAMCGGTLGVIVASFFAPLLKKFGDTFNAHTIADFFKARYSEQSKTWASILVIGVYLSLTAAQFVGLTTLLEVWTGITFSSLIWFAAISTIIYTAFAGIKSDFYTDIVHFFVMAIVLFLVLLPLTVKEIGGIYSLSNLPSIYFDPFAHGGVSFFIAGVIFGIGSVFITMEFWQRIYASKTASIARRALASSVLIIIAFYGASAFFGMAYKLINPNLLNSDMALFQLMSKLLPTGLLGLGIAGFLAIFISTINSTIMVCSASLTKDILLSKNYESCTDKKKLNYARVSSLICGFLSLILAFLYPDLVALAVNSLFSLIVLIPSIVGGFFWKKATAKGATYSLISGISVLLVFMFFDPETAFVPAFIVSFIIFIVVSLSTYKADQLDKRHSFFKS